MPHLYGIRRAAVIAAVAAIGSLSWSASAMAGVSTTFNPFVTIGPIAVHHGYSETINVSPCNSPYAGATVFFQKTFGKSFESHSYYGGTATCMMSTLQTGTITIDIPGIATATLAFTGGRAKNAPLPRGCTGTPSRVANGTFQGSLSVQADKRFFGATRRSRIRGSAESLGNLSCRGFGNVGKGSIDLSATFGKAGSMSLNAFQPTRGLRSVNVSVFRKLSRNTYSSHFIEEIGGSSLFNAPSTRSATIGHQSPLTSGHLSFTGGACQSPGYSRTGKLHGTLDANIDTIGTVALRGGSATYVSISKYATKC